MHCCWEEPEQTVILLGCSGSRPSHPKVNPMLLSAVLIIVALLLMVLAIWGWGRATDRPTNPRERDLPWC